MADPAVPRPAPVADPILRVDDEVLSLADALPHPLQHPPAVRQTCRCGKDGSPFAHGLIPGRTRPFTCDEVLEIRARVEFGQRHPLARLVARLRGQAPEGWTR